MLIEIPADVIGEIMHRCDMWTSFQIAVTCRLSLATFKHKLTTLVQQGFGDFARIMSSTRLQRGFAQILLDNYFSKITIYDLNARLSDELNNTVIEQYIKNFTNINNISRFGSNDQLFQPKSGEINVNVLLNVKLSPMYAYINIPVISRLLFDLLNSGHVSIVAAVVYLQKWNVEYLRKVIYGIYSTKTTHWLHPDVTDAPLADVYMCKECIYGNMGRYDPALSDIIANLGYQKYSYPYHIAYAYKYINYWV
ncbi:hypothetical protein PRJ_Fausto_00047 [Faustovirus]|nr:hypothetical protein PRJ_Fausto_00047 [Faustovirus]QBR98960.1 hypothetical protein [Faustovirus mariensis]